MERTRAKKPPKKTVRAKPAPKPATQILPTGVSASSEIRKHYFLNRYVIIAPKRNLRPDSFDGTKTQHKSDTIWPGINDPALFELKSAAGGWDVKVIGNLYPALSPDNKKAFGHQEVVVETPDPKREFSELPQEHIEKILGVFHIRLQVLRTAAGIKYVSIFKNDGPKAGASIAHAHSQIIALPIIPPQIQHEAETLKEYRGLHGTCAYCDAISWERQQKVRMIYEDKNVAAFSPFAGSAPFGLWLIPKRHVSTFTELEPGERRSLAIVLKSATSRLDQSQFSYNFFLHEGVDGYDHHFVLKIEPRIAIFAGLELSTGIIVNPVPPEYAALWYKNKLG